MQKVRPLPLPCVCVHTHTHTLATSIMIYTLAPLSHAHASLPQGSAPSHTKSHKNHTNAQVSKGGTQLNLHTSLWKACSDLDEASTISSPANRPTNHHHHHHNNTTPHVLLTSCSASPTARAHCTNVTPTHATTNRTKTRASACRNNIPDTSSTSCSSVPPTLRHTDTQTNKQGRRLDSSRTTLSQRTPTARGAHR